MSKKMNCDLSIPLKHAETSVSGLSDSTCQRMHGTCITELNI